MYILQWVLATAFCGGGFALVAWAVFADRARGRRRCPRCWYDMTAIDTPTCPECGRTPRHERALGRTRRRWRYALCGLAVTTIGLSPWIVPWVQRGGWIRHTPTWALRLASPLLDGPSDQYATNTFTGNSSAPRENLTPWERLLVARFVQEKLGEEADSLRAIGKSSVRLSRAEGGYVMSAGPEWRLFEEELRAVMLEMNRLHAAGADLAGLSNWVGLCAAVGPSAAEHSPLLLRLAQEERLPIGLRLRAIEAIESMGAAAGQSILALLDIPLEPYARSRVLTSVANHRLLPLEEIVELFVEEMFSLPENPGSLYLTTMLKLLAPEEYGRHPAIIEATRRIAKEHEDPEMRKVATWQLEYGRAAPPGVYRLPAGDTQKLYILNVPVPETEAPSAGWGLILVLPGGDASAESQPFVTRIAREALPEGYLLAHMVAPGWARDLSIVWPVEQDRLPELDFLTEEFAGAVIEDLKGRYQLDESRILVMGWAEGGMAAYALIVDQNLPVGGGLVAMSDFEPARLQESVKAEGKSIYILHSLEDERVAHRFAQEAHEFLVDSGARTRLDAYSGGHGWNDDAFGRIRHAIEWLDQERP